MTFQSKIAGSFKPGSVAPPPTNAESLRHMAECILGDEGDSVMWRHALISAAVELEALHARIAALESRAAKAAERAVKAIELLTQAREG